MKDLHQKKSKLSTFRTKTFIIYTQLFFKFSGSDIESLPFHFYKESEISGELFAISENYHYFCYGGKIYSGNKN
jgi:hypothetical protein